MRIAVAFDHRGVKLRERILETVAGLGHEIVDLGTDRPEPRIDYPVKAREIGEAIRSGDMLQHGKLAEMIERDAVVGVTSNPTIFQKARSSGDAYDDQLKALLDTEDDLKEIFLKLSAEDVKGGLDLLRPVFDRTNGLDGYVSWEADPESAYDRESTYEEAKRLHEWIEEPNLYGKIPATAPGVGAIEDSVADGRNINVTLIFSLQRHEEVMDAYVRGLERFVESGGDPSTVRSVASFFVSRVDTEADKRLEQVGRSDLQGKLAVANAKLAYQNY